MGAVEKLIDVVAQGVGAIAKPWMIKRVARAEGERLKILAAAQGDIDRERRLLQEGESAEQNQLTAGDVEEIDLEAIDHRIEHRVAHHERRRQLNLEAISLGAADAIKELPEVSTDPVDEGWIARFFSEAQEVSNPELQEIWSQLLAREVVRPGEVSLRTLDTLRNLSPAEARLIQSLSSYVVIPDLKHSGERMYFLRAAGVLGTARLLQDCGLIGVTSHFASKEFPQGLTWYHGGLRLDFKPRDTFFDVKAYPLTTAGEDIVRIAGVSAEPCIYMLQELHDRYDRNFELTVHIAGKEIDLTDYLERAKHDPKEK